MPPRLAKPCAHPGCGALVRDGSRHCPRHAKQAQDADDSWRGSATERGYDHRWRQARAIYLRANPLCVRCLGLGEVVAAALIDHIRPHKGDMALFWDRGNWQALCQPCHDMHKQAAEARGEFPDWR
ncbi:HNH endonuclease [Chitinimonas sp.]|uniref:HNH endonuclease n=1 Tax=Chitinimonas sp. TaxID=1934313 RepID=UPI0035B03CE1